MLIIQFVLFKKITDSMKVYVKHNNTVRLRNDIKRISTCKKCFYSKYIAVWTWIWKTKLALFSSADTLISNALKLFIYFLFGQQIKFCMLCRSRLEKEFYSPFPRWFSLNNLKTVKVLTLVFCSIQFNNILLEKSVPNLVPLTYPSLQILWKTLTGVFLISGYTVSPL